MQADVLNSSMDVIGVVDDFKSFIWTERCRSYSEFEIETTATKEHIDLFQPKCYISLPESDKLMIIDTIEYSSNADQENLMLISGKSLEYILHKRIIWADTILSGSVQDSIKKLLNENAISPSNSKRVLPRLRFKASTDSRITSLTFEEETQYWTDNLYDTIAELCVQYKICFKVSLTSDDYFEFELFHGEDRTYDQNENFAVVFSPEYGNLMSSKFVKSIADIKNAALVVGEKRTETLEINDVSTSKDIQYTSEIEGSETGLDREELYVDQTSLSMFVNDIAVPKERYVARLKSKGETALSETTKESAMEAELDFNGQFQYGRDYWIGDILEVENAVGVRLKVQITEFMRCQDTTGDHLSPEFEPFEEEN